MIYLGLGAMIVGITLGLLGSGGSILTVPILHYLLGHEDKSAIAESLAIVGGISLIGVIPFISRRLVDWRCVLFFGIPGMIGTFLGAWLGKYIPGTFQLILFAIVMMAAAWTMLRTGKVLPADTSAKGNDLKKGVQQSASAKPLDNWKFVITGLIVGVVTGLVGVGGGFLIIPALVIFGRLPMRVAIGTSLSIIALQSSTGFVKYLEVLKSVSQQVNWLTIIAFIVIGAAGTLIGSAIGGRINQHVLKRAFGVFLIVMSIFVFANEIPNIAVNTNKHAAVTGSLKSPAFSSGLQVLKAK